MSTEIFAFKLVTPGKERELLIAGTISKVKHCESHKTEIILQLICKKSGSKNVQKT